MVQQQRTYPQGVTSWVDIEQADVDRALEFYRAVLGWTFHEAAPPGAPFRYVIAQVDGLDAAGIGSGGPDDPAWKTYVAVDDVTAAVDRVVAAGGTVTTGPTVAGEGGTWAELTDPSGARLRLWQAKRRLGAQVVNSPGAWNFSDLHADHPATEFYVSAFGWEFSDAFVATMIRVPGTATTWSPPPTPTSASARPASPSRRGSRTPSAGWHPRRTASRRTGT